jgi:hypothetical protein
MSLIEDLLSTGTGGIVTQLANQFGVTGDQAKSAVSTLVPSLAGGIKEKLADSQAAPAISQLIAGGGLSGFVDNPASLGGPEAAKQGNSILGMIFSAGDVTNLVSGVAEKTGISSGVVTNMLPVLMALLGGFLSKNMASGKTSLSDLTGSLASGPGILGAMKSLVHKVAG